MSATRSTALNAPFAYLDTVPIPIVISDPGDGNIFYSNREFCNAYGYDPKEIIGSPISSLYHDPDDWDSIQKIISKNKKVKNYEVRNTHRDGTLRWTLLSVDTLRVEDGTSALLLTFIDITEQRNDDVIQQESAKLYQTIFNATPVMLWVKDTKNRTLQINQAAADFEGVDPKDVAGKSTYDLYPLEQAEAFYQDDLEVINSGQPKLGIIEEHTAVGKGDVMWVETGKVPIRDANGEITGVMAFAIDITESQKALERRGEQVDLTTQVAQEIATADDINSIYQRVVTLVKERFGYYHTQIFTYNQNTDAMQLVVGYGKIGEKMRKASHKLAVGHGVVGTAAATGKPALASDVTQDHNWRPNPNLPKTKGELAVPIKFQNEVLGILDVQSNRAGALTEDDVLLLENLAGQIAIAIENARLRDEMAIRIEEIESLYRSVRKAEGITKLDNQISLAFLPEKERVEHNVDQWLEDIEQTITQRNANLDTSKNGNDAPLMITPLNIHGDIIGALGIQPDDIDKLSEEDLEMLKAVSDQVAQALENARLFNETKRRTEELASLNEIISAASQSLETETILETVMNKVLEITEFDGGLITMFNSSRGKLERAIRIGMPGKSPEDPAQGLDGSLCDHVYQNGKTMVIQDIATGTPKGVNAQGDIKAGLHGYIGIPVESKGRTLGTLCLFRYKNEPIPDNLVELTRTIGGQLGFTLENARLFDESRKFRLGLERSADAVFLTDLDGTIVYANPSFEKIYGFPLDEVIGQNPRIIKSGVIPKEQYEYFWETLLNKETVAGEIINKTKDGRLIPIEGTNSPILDENGNILGFLAIHSDISKRKEDEEALQRRNEYLAASAEIGRLVTSTLDLEAIFSRSVNLIVERFGFYHASIFIIEETGFNAILKEATGAVGQKLKERKHSLAVGSNSTVGKATSTGEVVVINDTVNDTLHKHNPLLPETKAEAAIPLRVGQRIIGTLDIQSTEIDAFSEDDIAILQLLADQVAVGIDNARSYNIAQEAVEEMREIDRLKSQFLANMSHELRTPLNSIIGFARVILKGIDGPITDLQQQDLTAIFNSGQHLLGLINDILDLSRIEAGKMELTFDDVSISDLIPSVMSTAAGLVKDKPIELKSEIEENLPMVRADAMRVRQVLINFLSNAAKFTDEGDITVKATLEEQEEGPQSVMIRVIDTGPGIAQEDQAKLFQPFSQVDASLTRKVGGSGLGLSICHHLIQMHNGQIGVDSAPGKGSVFYFSIPVAQSKPQTGGLDSDRVILAIDDDPKIIKLYKRYLEPKGYHVIGLSNPAKAKERAEELKPFAITLDIMMPGFDGWQVLTDLKSFSETRDIPVIVCSIVEDEEKGFSLGAADYLVKPVMEEDLLASLDRLNGDGSIREVLVIDDDPNDLRLLGKMIAEQGRYKAILAEGGLSGWNAIKSKIPHAIVLDLFMPEMDGFTILENLRKDKKLRDLPVVVITGADLTTEQHKQLDSLGQRLLQKSSMKEKDLIATIENALERTKPN